jgi:hypothetical protein
MLGSQPRRPTAQRAAQATCEHPVPAIHAGTSLHYEPAPAGSSHQPAPQRRTPPNARAAGDVISSARNRPAKRSFSRPQAPGFLAPTSTEPCPGSSGRLASHHARHAAKLGRQARELYHPDQRVAARLASVLRDRLGLRDAGDAQAGTPTSGAGSARFSCATGNANERSFASSSPSGVNRRAAWRGVYQGRRSWWALSHSYPVDQGLRVRYFTDRGLLLLVDMHHRAHQDIVAPDPPQLALWG